MKTHYKLDGSYTPTFEAISKAGGSRAVTDIQTKADKLYADFLPKHSNLGSMAAMHWKQCCERAAIYLSIKDVYPENALEWVELSSKAHGEQVGASISKTMKLSGMKRLFIPMMKKIANMMFGRKAGFENRLISYDQESIRFDILRCPYCIYLAELGCPELTGSFCRSDEYAYGSLDAMEFKRTQTLGTGGSLCDFYMARKSMEGRVK